jgi:hypothetical protein
MVLHCFFPGRPQKHTLVEDVGHFPISLLSICRGRMS